MDIGKQNQENEKKQSAGKAFAKRFFKIIAITLAMVFVIIGGAFGIYALTGGFQNKVIRIRKLYFGDNENDNVQVIETLEDVTTRINYSPVDATNKTVDLIITDNYGILENPPSKVTVGEDFTLKLRKDENGNNIGGFVEIKTKDDRSAELITTATIKIYVDVAIPDGALYFEGNNSGKVTLGGKQYTLPVSEKAQYINLRSTLKNAFDLQLNNENVKNAYVNYTYYKKNGEIYDTKTFSSDELGLNYVTNPQTLKRDYSYFQIPIYANEPGTIKLEAKMHRTHEIEEEFEREGFERLPDMLSSQSDEKYTLLSKYNEFINKYIRYFDKTHESYEFFKDFLNVSTGLINFSTPTQVKKSFEYVYVKTSATINVSSIRIDSLSATPNPSNVVKFNVFDEKNYSIKGNTSGSMLSIIKDFGLAIKTDNGSNTSAEQEEKDFMFESLHVSPYLYLDANLVESINDEKQTITWENREYPYMPVYRFIGEADPNSGYNTPDIEPSANLEAIGYLLRLSGTDEYFSVTEVVGTAQQQNKYWNIKFNVPMPETQSEEKQRALYIGFDVTGLSIEDETKMVTKYAFTRVFVNYTDYEFVGQNSNLTLNNSYEGASGQMTINTKLANTNNVLAGDDTTRQNIGIDTTSLNIENYDKVSYKSVMYFAESNSNTVGQSKKVATVGKYKFIDYTNSYTGSVDGQVMLYKYGDQDLVGERILTYNNRTVNGVSTRNYYIQALNASTEPVKVFAVVYLSDKKGNPIDIYGRRLTIDEANFNENVIPELVVIRITDYTNMPSITINSYLEEANFYTESLIDKTITYDLNSAYTFNTGFINRNSINSFVTEDGTVVADKVGVDQDGNEVNYTGLSQIQDFLKLKLLKDNYFTLYLTGYELSSSGDIVEQENPLVDLSTFNDVFNTKQLRMSYSINVNNNRAIAFNNFCEHFSDFGLTTGSNIDIIESNIEKDAEDNAIKIKFVLHATAVNSTSQNSLISVKLPESGTGIPYSTTLRVGDDNTDPQNNGRYNYASYEVNQMVVTDVKVDDSDDKIKYKNKLYATYANIIDGGEKDESRLGELAFNVKNDTVSFSEYKFSLDENGDIYYNVYTNLQDESGINLNYVDCSQAGIRNDFEEDVTSDPSLKYFKTIDDYIAQYLDSSSSKITYRNTTEIISFSENYAFSNMNLNGNYGNYLFFGTHQFEINKDLIVPTVDINGFVLNLVRDEENENAFTLTIPAGSYFPLVDGKALIYNESFEIHTETDGSNYINNYVSNEWSGIRIPVVKGASILTTDSGTKTFNARTYIDDNSTFANNSAIKKLPDGLGTINFLQGEEIGGNAIADNGGKFVEDNGKYKLADNSSADQQKQKYTINTTFEEDENGNYYFDTTDNTYKLISTGGETAQGLTRYSKKGVTVYLLISYNIGSHSDGTTYDYNFYRMIEYEILQEEIEIVGINRYEDNTPIINSLATPLNIKAGEESTIVVGTPAKDSFAYITYRATGESYFLQHVKFSMESGSVDADLTAPTTENSSIKVEYPHLTSDTSGSIVMSYKYKGVDKTARFSLMVSKDISFEPKADKNDIKKRVTLDGESDGTDVYQISYNSTQDINVNSIFDTYFDISTTSGGLDAEQFNYKLSWTNKNKYSGRIENGSTIENFTSNGANSSFKLLPSYVEKTSGNNNLDYVVFNVSIVLADGREVDVNRKLQILINPTYTMDFSALESEDINIFNGEDLYGEFIKLYSGTSQSLVTNEDTYNSLFKFKVENDDGVESRYNVKDGKISVVSGTPTTDTNIRLTLSYTEFGTTVQAKTFNVTIRGIEMYFDENGGFNENITSEYLNTLSNKKLTTTSTHTINISSGSDIEELNKYFIFAYVSSEEGGSKTYTQLQAVFVDDDGQIVKAEDLRDITESATYTLGYAIETGGEGFRLIETFSGKVTINVQS